MPAVARNHVWGTFWNNFGETSISCRYNVHYSTDTVRDFKPAYDACNTFTIWNSKCYRLSNFFINRIQNITILNLIVNLFFVIIVKIYFYCRYNVFWIHFVCIFLCYNMYRIKEDTFNPHYDLWQLFVKFSVIYMFFVAPLVLMIRKIKLVWK